MSLLVINCEQGSPDWFAARMGIPTASEFATVMAKGEGKTRSAYMRKLAGEILTGEPMETYTNPHMERGNAQEDEARALYELMIGEKTERVGFLRNNGRGCSPDSLVGAKGGLEIKTALPHIQIERLLKNELPPEHRAQVQGNLLVSEREFWDFVSYCPKLPPLMLRIYREETYLKQLSDAVDQFNNELAAMVDCIRNLYRDKAA